WWRQNRDKFDWLIQESPRLDSRGVSNNARSQKRGNTHEGGQCQQEKSALLRSNSIFAPGVGVFGLPLRIFDFPGDHSHDIYGESFPRRVIPFFITSSEPQVGQIR
ncbi:hypothetical protein QUA35_16250, partial [Microcoleus sp. N9_B2]|uniref:hypothetical protein n=1 Tax=unclassified Microcoleus TaxID=2642155 RepID=UPI002FD19800